MAFALAPRLRVDGASKGPVTVIPTENQGGSGLRGLATLVYVVPFQRPHVYDGVRLGCDRVQSTGRR
jgi:hypothetical protein